MLGEINGMKSTVDAIVMELVCSPEKTHDEVVVGEVIPMIVHRFASETSNDHYDGHEQPDHSKKLHSIKPNIHFIQVAD